LPVLAGIMALDSFSNISGTDAGYNQVYGQFGGHAVTIVGYDDTRYGGAFKILNSYGQQWGDRGYFWLPYEFASTTPSGYNQTILMVAFTIKDGDNHIEVITENTNDFVPTQPTTEQTEPLPVSDDLPNLQVADWFMNYETRPGGLGKLQYKIVNTGKAMANAGADISLVLSQDATISSNDILVVYEPIVYDLAPGQYVYRDENNVIMFHLPTYISPGTYYLALWVDSLNRIKESNEKDNMLLSERTATIVNNLCDLLIDSWYAKWDAYGNAYLIFQVRNAGATEAPGGFDISLVLSKDQLIGNGDEIVMFSEKSYYNLAPGNYVYPDIYTTSTFYLNSDINGNPIPAGTYYMALWVDRLGVLQESDKNNNYSLSSNQLNLDLSRTKHQEGELYNGKPLPQRNTIQRQVNIEKPLPKELRGSDQIVFPTTQGFPMGKK
ncbi:MAG: hypothetical protein HQK77_15490, partial [Desulfobacterales bacterium]|nr:hypothetical protein [Desulfobacterales bacterium]